MNRILNRTLDRAVQELRDETARETDGSITWQRIEGEGLHRKARARSIRRMSGVVALALLVGGGALAATMVLHPRPEPGPGPGSGPLARPSIGAPSTTPGPAKPSPSSAAALSAQTPSIPAAVPPGNQATVAAPGAGSTRHARRAPEVHPAAQDQPAGDAVTAAYAAAHKAHFVDRDWRHALDLWARYLALAPTGSLAPEAHFNRAICLLRLERRDEAVAELAPFAAGRWGGYRQSEASKLLAPP